MDNPGLQQYYNGQFTHFKRTLQDSTLHTAGTLVAETQEEGKSTFQPDIDLLFYLRFLVATGPEAVEDFVGHLYINRARLDGPPRPCTLKKTASEAAGAVTRSLRDSFDAFRERAAAGDELTADADFRRATVIAAYTKQSADVWHSYNKTKLAGLAMDNELLQKDIARVIKGRQPYQDALRSHLADADAERMKESIQKALREPELKGSTLSSLGLERQEAISDMVDLLDKEWTKQVASTWTSGAASNAQAGGSA